MRVAQPTMELEETRETDTRWKRSLRMPLACCARSMSLDVLFAIGSSVLLGLSITLQKRGVGDTWRASVKSPLWIAGVIVELVADGLYLVAAGAPGARITIIQPIVALHFLVAMGTAMLFLREQLRARERLAATLLIGGGVLVLAAPVDRHLDAVIDRTSALLLAIGAMIAGALCVRGRGTSETRGAIAAGLVFSGSVVATRIAGIDLRSDTTSILSPALVVVGNVGGFVLVQRALRRGRAAVVSPIVALVTLIVPLPIGIFALHESVSALALTGSLVVALGLGILRFGRAT